MTIKVTVPNTSSDSLTFGSANTPTAAQVIGIDSGSSNGQLAFNTAASGTSTERMRISSAGNVGIGVVPAAWGTNYKGLQVGTLGSLSYTDYTTSLGNNFYSTNTNDVALITGNMAKYEQGSTHVWKVSFANSGANISWTEAARIDSSGNLLVGTTSALGTSKFVVAADTTTTNPMTVSNTRSTAATDYSILFYRNASLVGSVQTSLSATSYVTSSDYRLKENIAPMTGALSKVAQLKPCTYNWKLDGEASQGFIAHELAEVVPECVVGEKDAIDAEGKPVYQGIDTSFLVATLTAALQELKAIVDTQAAKIAALEAK